MKVLVTGAAGYVGGHVIRELFEHGHTVRGTVRDLGAEDKIGYLKALGDIELVAADLTVDAGWDEAVAGCDVVLHTASPFFLSDDESKLVEPAVEGTLRVLKAAHREGVKRVVLTSSAAAIVNTPAERYTEDQWSDVDTCSPYPKSKTLAERAAWNFVEDKEMELVSCNPCLVLGPLQSDRLSLSVKVVERLLGRMLPAVPHLGFSIVDVRDVAIAHRLAMELPEAAGQRYLLMSGHLWMKEMSALLKECFGHQGFRPPTMGLPYPILWLAARFDAGARSVLPDVGKHKILDATKARTELGWTPRPVKESVLETGQSLVDRGIVKP
jgi:dihydroflavonol-4-reductase